MKDEFNEHITGLTAPAVAAEVISPSDTENLEFVTRAIYLGQGGDLSVTMKSGDTVLLRGMQAGVFYPLRLSHVRATGTTATDIVGLR